MADAVFALRYGAIELAARVIPHSVGPTMAFLPLENPLPVGTTVELEAGAARGSARVVRVVESTKRGEGARGIWVELVEPGEPMRSVWEPLVAGADPQIPEPVGGDAVLAPSEIRRPRAGVETREEEARRGDASEVVEDDGRRTQIMSAVDVAAALAREAETASEPNAGQTLPFGADPDAGQTLPLGAEPDPEPAGKKKRRRRRR